MLYLFDSLTITGDFLPLTIVKHKYRDIHIMNLDLQVNFSEKPILKQVSGKLAETFW